MRSALKPASEVAANKLLGLEALRFLTAFAILVYHYRHFAFIADEPVDVVPEQLPLYSLLQPLHDSGAFGVWVFWCISGFIFFWKYRDPIAERSVGAWKFFVLRFSRLYPLHLVTLLIVALLQPAYFSLRGCFFVYLDNDLSHFIAQLFMATNWNIVYGQSFNGPIWSISVEALVYFVFFVVLLATRSWLLNVAIVAACLGVTYVLAASQVISCLALFYVGGLAAMARKAVATAAFRPLIEAGAWVAALIIPPAIVSLAGDQLDRIDLPLFLTCTPILLFCLSREISVPAPLQKAIEAAGNMTYSSYLLHFPLQLVVVIGYAAAGLQIPLYDVSFFTAYLATTLLASYLTYRNFEAPAQNIIRGYLLRARTVAAKAALGATE